MKHPVEARLRRSSRGGFTLIETVIAVLLLSIIFLGLAQVYARGQRQINYEEDRRKATAVAQARLDGIRRDFGYDGLAALDGSDTTFVVDNRAFLVSHIVTTDVPEPQSTTLDLTVTWVAQLPGGGTVNRTLDCTTILGRGMP